MSHDTFSGYNGVRGNTGLLEVAASSYVKNSTSDYMWSRKEGVSGIKHFYWVLLYRTIMFLYIKFL